MSVQNSPDNSQRREANSGCGCLLLVMLIAVGVASFFAIAENADFPGADTLRTVGREVDELYQQSRQRLSGNDVPEEPKQPSPPVAAATPEPPSQSSAARPSSTEPATTYATSQRPDLRHYEYKTYMLELINNERAKAGVPPVVLGDNIAAQLHAENALANCFSGHWGVDGLKPYMRYSLAGGYQSSEENATGSDYCIKDSDRYRALGNIRTEVREAMEGWMNSPGHRRAILGKWHRRVNIGLAWDKYNFKGVQQFEGDYVEYSQLPGITDGILSFSGSAINDLRFSGREELGLQIYYDPPPHSLSRGQVSRTYCLNPGLRIASLRYPLTGNYFWEEDEYEAEYSLCPDPLDVPRNAPAPRSFEEAREFWERAYNASQTRDEQTIIVPLITASEWTARGTDFSVTADISGLLSDYGPGVYTVTLWGEMGGEDALISEYSIFHEIEPPDTYSSDHWK